MRKFLLTVHCYVGLAVAVFLVVAGLTGSILVFGSDYDHWLHPSLWRVMPEGALPTEQELVDRVERQLEIQGSTARVEQIDFSGRRSAQVFALTDGRMVFVNPYGGAILGTRDRPSAVENFLADVEALHVRLLAGNTGEWIVDLATAALLLLVPTGVYLWWNKKRVTIKWTASWRRITWDLHNVSGIYGFVLVFLLAATGLLLAFETPLYWMVHSKPWNPGPLPRSVVAEGAQRTVRMPDLDDFMSAADRALPDAEIYQLDLPMRPRSPVQVLKHGPGMAGHSTVYLDRYSARVLRVDDLRKLPRAYRAHFINQAIHMGTIIGLPSKILLSLSSLVLVISVITGCIIWRKKVIA